MSTFQQFMNVFLQPCSGRKVVEQLKESLASGDPLNHFKGKIDPQTFEKLKALKTNTIHSWTIKQGSRTHAWENLHEGDIVLFSAKKRFLYMGIVYAKAHLTEEPKNKNQSANLKANGEDIFFIKDGKSIEIPYKPEILNYKEKHIIQGEQILRGDKAEKMRNYIESMEGNLFDEEQIEPSETERNKFFINIKEPTTVEEAIAEINRISDENVNTPVKEKIKAAKMLVRDPRFARLVKERVKYVCEICGTRPFLQKNGRPFSEAHHLQELSKTRLDNPKKMISVCPTCHRVVHFGTDEELKKRQALNPGNPKG